MKNMIEVAKEVAADVSASFLKLPVEWRVAFVALGGLVLVGWAK